jgi:cytochrome c peroxidase
VISRTPLWWLAAASLVVAGLAHAHGGEHDGEAASETQVLAPGYGALEYTPPAPGTYALPPLGTAADGEVLGSGGAPTTLYDVFGERVVVLSFIYASCSDVNGCPLATAVLHRVQRRLRDEPELADRLRLVSLSFDPVRDTPEVMRRYGEGFRGGGVEWTFLTSASEAQLQPLLDAYGQSLRKEYDAEGRYLGSISHILRVFLIDRARRIRNIYSVSFLHPDTLTNDVKTLLLEERGVAPAVTAGAASRGDAPGLSGPGDYREGYERPDYRTRSRGVSARRGEPADLLAHAREAPLGLPPLAAPADNPLTPEKVALGRKLFYDRRLSLNGTFSCAMCHIPEQGFTSNELATAVGIEGRTVRRNAPTVYNVAYLPRLFHDGRETRLEHQVWGPLLARNEMGNPSIGAVVERLARLPDYAGRFEAAFPGRGLGMETLGMAIASYERTLVSGGSPFDRWYYRKDASALSPGPRRGFALFSGKAGCSACHSVGADSALFTDGSFHNTGIGYAASMLSEPEKRRILVSPGRYLPLDREVLAQVSEPPPSDLGLYEITQDPDDRWKYRTPSLRNVALTAPYMHDGSLPTLRDVVAFYNRGGVPNEVLDPLIRPLGLSAPEMDDLVAFLESLTGDDVDLLVGDALSAPIGDVGQGEQPSTAGGQREP